jgi:protein-disulfide isomerase
MQNTVSCLDSIPMTLPRDSDRLILPVSRRDRRQGSFTAEITLVQYGDYQCPACQSVDRMIQSIQQQLGDRILFVFRHFPQSDIHPEAHHAAEAAEAAASQNKFWEMHTHLFAHQFQLADSDLVEYAIALHLDVNQFLHEMATDFHMARVQEDIESGIQSNVTQTPTFFVNDRKCNDNLSLNTLLEAIAQGNSDG